MPAALIPILSLLKSPWVLVIIACVLGIGGTGWYRMRYESCVAARAADVLNAERAKSAALEDARVRSDAIITEQAQAIAARAGVVNTITERIIHVPVTTACAGSPAMRAASDGLRELFSPGGGQAPAGGKPPAAVPRPRTGR